MRYLFIFLFLSAALSAQTPNQVPVITGLSVAADWNANTLTVTYDVSDAENDPLEISLGLSADGGKTYGLTAQVGVTGDLGFPVTPGTGRTITCDIGQLAALQNANFTVRLVADDKQPFDLQSLVDEVDSLRLKADLGFLEGIRHRNTGLNHLNATRDSLRAHFSGLGLALEEKTFAYGNATGINILGHQPGIDSAGKVVIVDAHYDTVNDAPGADDNGSGVAGVMEISRLLSLYPAEKTLRYIGFDLEEDGLRGSLNYTAGGIPAGEQVQGVFNFEMIGYYSEQPNSQTIPAGFDVFFPDATAQINANQKKGDFITNVANSKCQSLALLFSNAAIQYVPGLKVVTLVAPGDGSAFSDLLRSDHAPFWFTNRPALMLTDGANFRNECYHTPQDMAAGKLNFTFMANVTKATLAAAAQLAGIRHGDWATANFQGLVPATEAPDCRFALRYASGAGSHLRITAGDCPATELRGEIHDEKGMLLQTTDLQGTAREFTVPVPDLVPGIYFAKVAWPGGWRTLKFSVAR